MHLQNWMCRKCGCRSNFCHPVEIQGRFKLWSFHTAGLLWSITFASETWDRNFRHLYEWFGGFKRIWNSQQKLDWKLQCTYHEGEAVSSVDQIVTIFAVIMMICSVPCRLLRCWIGDATSKTFSNNRMSQAEWADHQRHGQVNGLSLEFIHSLPKLYFALLAFNLLMSCQQKRGVNFGGYLTLSGHPKCKISFLNICGHKERRRQQSPIAYQSIILTIETLRASTPVAGELEPFSRTCLSNTV